MTKKEFEAAIILMSGAAVLSNSSGLKAAYKHLVDGLSQTQAAKMFDISRQRVWSASKRVCEAHENATKIKLLLEQNPDPIGETAFLIATLAMPGPGSSKTTLAIKEIFSGLSVRQAAEKFQLDESTLYNGLATFRDHLVRARLIASKLD